MTTNFNSNAESVRRRAVVSLVLCCLALGIGAAGFAVLASLKPDAMERMPADPVYNVEVFRIEKTDLQRMVPAFGTVRADREVVLAAQIAGEVDGILGRLRIGEFIRGAGPDAENDEPADSAAIGEGETAASLSDQDSEFNPDILVQIDPRLYQQRVVQANSRLSEDQAELRQITLEEANGRRLLERTRADYETFRVEYERLRELAGQNAVTSSQLADAEIQLRRYEVALLQEQDALTLIPIRRSQVEQRIATHESELELARIELKRTQILSPFSGRLSEVMVEKGQYLRVGDPLVRVTDISRVEIPLALSLGDYPAIADRIALGETVEVKLAESTSSEAIWTGTISRVSPEADENTRTVTVFADVDNETGLNAGCPRLLPGTFVHARIEGPVLVDSLPIPRDCIINGSIFVLRETERVDQDRMQAEPGRMASSSVVERRPVRVVSRFESLALIAEENPDGTLNRSGDRLIMTNLDVIHEGVAAAFEIEHRLSTEMENQQFETVRKVPR